MSWDTSVLDLRTLLSDGEKDRLRYRKKVFGQINGSNKTFKTLEYKRLTDLTQSPGPTGVFVNDTKVTVTADDIISGEFQLALAPVEGSTVEVTYYLQYFTDDELKSFNTAGVNWLGLGSDVTTVADGLRPSVIRYAAYEAYSKLAMRFMERLSETFLLADQPDPDRLKAVDTYNKLAQTFLKDATKLRDDFYTRQGQSLAPIYGSAIGRARDIQPKR